MTAEWYVNILFLSDLSIRIMPTVSFLVQIITFRIVFYTSFTLKLSLLYNTVFQTAINKNDALQQSIFPKTTKSSATWTSNGDIRSISYPCSLGTISTRRAGTSRNSLQKHRDRSLNYCDNTDWGWLAATPSAGHLRMNDDRWIFLIKGHLCHRKWMFQSVLCWDLCSWIVIISLQSPWLLLSWYELETTWMNP